MALPVEETHEEVLVEVLIEFLTENLKSYDEKGKLFNSRDRAKLLNRLLANTGVKLPVLVKTDVTLLGDKLSNLILHEPVLSQAKSTLLSRDPNSIGVVDEIKLLIFNNLVSFKIIDGQSTEFQGSDLVNEIDELSVNKKSEASPHEFNLQSKQPPLSISGLGDKLNQVNPIVRNFITNITSSKLCSYCDERIKANAKKCKHCGEWV